jgi:uncharacterized membrane protein
MKLQGQTMYALTKHAKYLEQVSTIDPGIHGAKPLALLLMLIIISIIVSKIGFAEIFVILHHLMDQHQIWSLRQRQNMAKNT